MLAEDYSPPRNAANLVEFIVVINECGPGQPEQSHKRRSIVFVQRWFHRWHRQQRLRNQPLPWRNAKEG